LPDISYRWFTDTLPGATPFSTDNPASFTIGPAPQTLFVQVLKLGCPQGYHTLRLEPYPAPAAGLTLTPNLPAQDSAAVLTAPTEPGISYFWRVNGNPIGTGITLQTAFTEGGPVYIELLAVNSLGCTTRTERRFIVKPPTYMPFSPNAFSPNGDGINDLFIIPGEYAPQVFFLRIFDRWGQMVAEITDPKGGWDGLDASGKPAPEDNYIYNLSVILSDDSPHERTGSVTLIR